MLVQGDKTGDECLADEAKSYIKRVYDKPGDVFLGVVHRLDRPVSGAVVLARTSKALERMNKLFKDREVDKTYWAITTHRPPNTEGELVHWIKKNTKINKSTAFNKDVSGSQKAILSSLYHSPLFFQGRQIFRFHNQYVQQSHRAVES